MNQKENKPQTKILVLGQIVKILRGRGIDSYAIVVGHVDERFVQIADGNKRKMDRPKKKNVLHVESQDYICEDIATNLLKTGKVSNSKLRRSLMEFLEHSSPVVIEGKERTLG